MLTNSNDYQIGADNLHPISQSRRTRDREAHMPQGTGREFVRVRRETRLGLKMYITT